MKHPHEFQSMNQGKASLVSATANFVVPGTSSSSVVNKKQLTMQESFKRKLHWDVNDPKAKKFHYLIAEMIALDNEPFSIVERTGFSRVLEQALPQYKMPSSTYISQNIVPDIYNKIYEKIKRNISSALAISVTSHIWTCEHNNASFISFTAHWLSPEFKLEHGVLAVKPFAGSHTRENIEKELSAIADRWEISHNKIHLLIYDSDLNIAKGVQLAEYDWAACFIHSLRRAINESLKSQPEVSTIISSSRRLVTHFSHSGIAQEKLLAIQKKLNLPQHQLVQDISTRWNSTFYMMERLLEQKQAISLLAADDDTITNLMPDQWILMQQCIELLKPFEEITKLTSSELSCVSEAIPHIAALKRYLDNDETVQRTSDLPLMRATLKAELEKRFRSLSQESKYLIATFLDPRFKTSYMGVLEAEKARQNIVLEFLKLSCDESSMSSSFSTPAKKIKQEETDSPLPCDANSTFWVCCDAVANENDNDNKTQIYEQNEIACEIDFYLKSVRIKRNDDPYKWWAANTAQYPYLSKLARIYLSTPCSSLFGERLFSETGLVYENRRNGLLPSDDAEQLVFIRYNLPLLEYKY